MALSTDHPVAAQDITPGSSTAASLNRRRDMAVVWWSTYLSLAFLAVFVYGLALLGRIARDPQPVAIVVAVSGALTMVPWVMTIRGARRRIDSTTFRTRTMGCAQPFLGSPPLCSVCGLLPPWVSAPYRSPLCWPPQRAFRRRWCADLFVGLGGHGRVGCHPSTGGRAGHHQ